MTAVLMVAGVLRCSSCYSKCRERPHRSRCPLLTARTGRRHDDGSSDGGTRLQVFKQVSTVMVAMDRIAHMTAVLMVARVSRCSA